MFNEIQLYKQMYFEQIKMYTGFLSRNNLYSHMYLNKLKFKIGFILKKSETFREWDARLGLETGDILVPDPQELGVLLLEVLQLLVLVEPPGQLGDLAERRRGPPAQHHDMSVIATFSVIRIFHGLDSGISCVVLPPPRPRRRGGGL